MQSCKTTNKLHIEIENHVIFDERQVFVIRFFIYPATILLCPRPLKGRILRRTLQPRCYYGHLSQPSVALYFLQTSFYQAYISSLSCFTRSSSRYSSKVLNRSIMPLGVSSITLLATVCIKVWSWLVSNTMPVYTVHCSLKL